MPGDFGISICSVLGLSTVLVSWDAHEGMILTEDGFAVVGVGVARAASESYRGALREGCASSCAAKKVSVRYYSCFMYMMTHLVV